MATSALLGLIAPPTSADPPGVERLAGPDRVATAVAISRATFATAETVVLAGSHAVPDVLAGGPLAAAHGGPLLLTGVDRLSPAVLEELDRLGTRQVIVVGGDQALGDVVVDTVSRTGRIVDRVAGSDRYETAAAVADRLLPFDAVVVASGTDPMTATIAAAAGSVSRSPVLLVEPDRVPEDVMALLDRVRPAVVTVLGTEEQVTPAVVAQLVAAGSEVQRLAHPDAFGTAVVVRDRLIADGVADAGQIWLASASEGGLADALAAGPAMAARRGALLLVEGAHLERAPVPAAAIRCSALGLSEVVLLGGERAISAAAGQQLDAITMGPGLPQTGSRTLVPEHLLVGLYGYHRSPILGVLGEQPPAEVAARAESFLAPVRAVSSRPVLPVYNLIATLATAEAGPDGLHRRRTTDEEIQPWLDAARTDGALLVLDVQPARADLLTEVQAYTHLLREPDVGIGLDIEWVVGPAGVPGQGAIGRITAAEINAVTAWLGALVAEHQLPEKLVIIHHFQDEQIPDIDQVLDVDGVSIVFDVDGIGTRPEKAATYGRLAQPSPLHNGLMIFLDQDGDLYSPDEALQVGPHLPQMLLYQ